MTHLDHGQVAASAAEVYEDLFVPALFAQWTAPILDTARVVPGNRVLDIACGTGVLARSAARRVGPNGWVGGVDINGGMLAVARRSAPAVEWRQGAAEDLPFDGDTFDAVVSQFGFMFFNDRKAALHEMARVARPDGRVALAVWASLDHSPGYSALAAVVGELFGDAAAAAIRAPFELGDAAELRSLVAEVFPNVVVTKGDGVARFGSMRSWLHTEVRGWTLSEMIDDEGFAELLAHAETKLAPFVTQGGGVEFPVKALIAAAGPPR